MKTAHETIFSVYLVNTNERQSNNNNNNVYKTHARQSAVTPYLARDHLHANLLGERYSLSTTPTELTQVAGSDRLLCAAVRKECFQLETSALLDTSGIQSKDWQTSSHTKLF